MDINHHNKEISGVKDNKDETAKEFEGTMDKREDKGKMVKLVVNKVILQEKEVDRRKIKL